jgi:hypothetical protein
MYSNPPKELCKAFILHIVVHIGTLCQTVVQFGFLLVVQRLCEQYMSTISLFLQHLTPAEARSLSYNTKTLSSQLQTALSMCTMYQSIYPSFSNLASSLPHGDTNSLYEYLITYCSDLLERNSAVLVTTLFISLSVVTLKQGHGGVLSSHRSNAI